MFLPGINHLRSSESEDDAKEQPNGEVGAKDSEQRRDEGSHDQGKGKGKEKVLGENAADSAIGFALFWVGKCVCFLLLDRAGSRQSGGAPHLGKDD